MELIDRYIYAVTQKLPQEERKDIADELRGVIEDMLDERVGRDEESDVEEILLELGSPRELADKYRGAKKYLIGPAIFDTYVLILKIVLTVIGSLIVVGFIIQTILDPPSILDYFIDMILAFVFALPMTFGWTTFGFAMGELGSLERKDLLGKEWSPADLPPIPDEKKHINRNESILGIISYVVFIVFFVFSIEYFGIWLFEDGFTGVVPFLNEATYPTYLLFIILILGFGILKECVKLVTRTWTKKLALFNTMVNAISIIALLIVINGPDFWNPQFMNDLVDAGLLTATSDTFHTLTIIWEQGTLWIFILLMIGLAWEAVSGFMKARK